jgi:hypothetical protein
LNIEATGVKFLKDLVVKNEDHHIVETTTINNKNNYTIHYPPGYILNDKNEHTFYIYAPVYDIKGQASIKTQLQNPANFSWTDIAGRKITPYTVENDTYFNNYPATVITAHN